MLLVVYAVGVLAITTYGLLCLLWPRAAYKVASAWTILLRAQRPDIDWGPYVRRLVPPRPVGLLLLLLGLWLLRPLVVLGLGVLGGASHVTTHDTVISSWLSLVALLGGIAAIVYMFVDPIGLLCFFTRQDRGRCPQEYRRSWPVIILASSFLIALLLVLFRVVTSRHLFP